jgi:hypothetical protein
MELAEFPLDGGGTVLVEVEETPGVVRVSRGRSVVEQVGSSFEQAMDRVRDAATAALTAFQQMATRPDEVELEFGVKLDAEVGAVIARTHVEGQLTVRLTWRAAAQ